MHYLSFEKKDTSPSVTKKVFQFVLWATLHLVNRMHENDLFVPPISSRSQPRSAKLEEGDDSLGWATKYFFSSGNLTMTQSPVAFVV